MEAVLRADTTDIREQNKAEAQRKVEERIQDGIRRSRT